jgi:putative ABC transport system permease protein
MNLFELVSFIIENIQRQKSRVLLTSLGVMVGSASIILLVALVGGLQKIVTAQFAGNRDLTKVTVSNGFGRFTGGGRTTSSTTTQLDITDDMISQFAAIPNVSMVVPQYSVSGTSTLSYQNFMGRANVTGIDVGDLSELGMNSDKGTTELHPGDVILGASVQDNFYRSNYAGVNSTLTEDLLGKRIKWSLSKQDSTGIKTKVISLKVAGILKETSDQSDYSVYIPMQDADKVYLWQNGERINHNDDSYSSAVIQVNDSNNVTDVADTITAMGYQAMTPQSFLENINTIFTVIQVIFGGVGAITLLVAAIGIANTMTMAILERTREIGLLKALGATNQDILVLFLGESAGIGFLGGVGGLILGVGLGKIINAVASPYLESQASASGTTLSGVSAVYMPLYLPIFALLFSTIIGCISGLFPSLRAASLLPVDALKHE